MATKSQIVRKIISSPSAPKVTLPYSPAVLVDHTLYVSGQLGMNPETGELVSGGVQEECRQALKNMGAILTAAGISYKNVVKVTVLLADINDFAAMNNIYKEFFTENFPARAAYQVAHLPKSGRIEIEAVAVVGEIVESKM